MFKLLLISLFFSMNLNATTLKEIVLDDFQKSTLSDAHVRFQNQKYIIHVQANQNIEARKWDSKTLDRDMSEMFQARKKMYEMMDVKDIKFDSYELSKTEKGYDQLNIQGFYITPKSRTSWFFENNVYINNNILQIKIVSNEKKLSQVEITNLLNLIKKDQLELK